MRVLILDIDTLRPDHLGCYGYPRDTSPNIDRIAAEGMRFDNYYCSDAPCLPSRSALVTGLFGIHNGAIGHGGTAGDLRLQGATRDARSDLIENNLWNLFRSAGLYTASISPFAERHSAYWFNAGLNEAHNTGREGLESAEEVTPIALKWIEENASRDNWVLHVNYWDPHTPYRAPESLGNPFENDPLPDWLTEETLQRHTGLAGPKTARDNGMYHGRQNPKYPRMAYDVNDMAALRRNIDGYDCGIRYADEHVGHLLAKLDGRGVLEDTIVIVTSDHGENFGELGIYSEHGTADAITHRIPMIVRWPGGPAGASVRGLHYSLDLLPTLAEMLGQDGNPMWDGRSFAETLRSGADTGRDELVLSQCVHVCQRSALWDRWLYMRTYHDGFHPHFGEEMLFDLKSDPHEQNDVAAERPDILAEGARRLANWHAEAMRTQPYGYTVDPMRVVLAEGGPSLTRGKIRATDYDKRLEGTGRGHWVPEIRRRHPQEFSE